MAVYNVCHTGWFVLLSWYRIKSVYTSPAHSHLIWLVGELGVMKEAGHVWLFVFWSIVLVAGCVTFLGKRWHRGVLWEEDVSAEAVWCSKHVLFGNRGSCIHIDVTLTQSINLSTAAAAQVHILMVSVFPDGNGLFQQDECDTLQILFSNRL